MKFNFMRRFITPVVLLAAIFLQSCHSDPGPSIGSGAAGFFIVNEGAFGNGNASISFYDRKADNVVNNVFAVKNGHSLGDQAQSMTIFNGKGYIVVQNSSKIEVINVDDYSSVATIADDLPSPRYFLGLSSSKAYVSDWGLDGNTGTIKIIDLTTNKVTGEIPTGHGTNRMLKVNNLVYVTNNGGYGFDNKVTIIDSNTDKVVSSITTGYGPNSIQRDKDGNLWVASGGSLVYNDDFSAIDEQNSTKGSISKISNNEEVLRLEVDHFTYEGLDNLVLSNDGKTLYYTFDGDLYSMSTTASTLPSAAFKSKFYNAVAIDPTNGNIVGCKAPSFGSAGSIEIMDPSGSLLESFDVGIAPNGCAFK